MLERLARRANLHPAIGMFSPYRPLRTEVYLHGTPRRTKVDVVRYGVLELLCRRIQECGVPGDVAEVGVGDGWWARAVNTHLPDRRLYLFDTFAGFDERDIEAEAEVGLPTAAPYELTSVASPETVLERLPGPDRAVARVGRFPETALGLEDQQFCLAGIDVGVHEVTRAALEWFYPRLAPGGYVVVADYNNSHAPGVKVAVDQFVASVGTALVPLIDYAASAVVVKPLSP